MNIGSDPPDKATSQILKNPNNRIPFFQPISKCAAQIVLAKGFSEMLALGLVVVVVREVVHEELLHAKKKRRRG